jgi:hypothetical protein
VPQVVIAEQRTQADALVKQIVALDDAKGALEARLASAEEMRDGDTSTLQGALEELYVLSPFHP